MTHYIGAIDQGTTSTRFIIFNRSGQIVGIGQKEHDQICKQPGWVEHDPVQIWEHTKPVIAQAMTQAGISAGLIPCFSKLFYPVDSTFVCEDMRN